eukprot:8567363-Karenia_brevis.AAC.1
MALQEGCCYIGVALVFGHQQILHVDSVAWELSNIPGEWCEDPYYISLQIPRLATTEHFNDVHVHQLDASTGRMQLSHGDGNLHQEDDDDDD